MLTFSNNCRLQEVAGSEDLMCADGDLLLQIAETADPRERKSLSYDRNRFAALTGMTMNEEIWLNEER